MNFGRDARGGLEENEEGDIDAARSTLTTRMNGTNLTGGLRNRSENEEGGFPPWLLADAPLGANTGRFMLVRALSAAACIRPNGRRLAGVEPWSFRRPRCPRGEFPGGILNDVPGNVISASSARCAPHVDPGEPGLTSAGPDPETKARISSRSSSHRRPSHAHQAFPHGSHEERRQRTPAAQARLVPSKSLT